MNIEELASLVKHEGPRVTETELTAFEQGLVAPLPEEFRRFLLLVGGGGELNESFEYEWEIPRHLGPVRRNYWIEIFCEPDGRDEYHSIRSLQRHIADMGYMCVGVPPEVVVIGDDWSGNFLTIDLRSSSYGQIGMVDHETVGDRFEDEETYAVIAPSFGAFAAKLRSE